MKYAILILSLVLFGCLQQEVASSGGAVQAQLPEEKPKREEIVVKLSWETPKEDRTTWSKALLKSIDDNYATLKTAKDVVKFCPKATALTEDQVKKAWAELFVAMALHESAFNPKTDYFEKTMGYYSRGLYQLSYEDESWAKCGLDKKTGNIYKPEVNISCAVKIMARQVKSKQAVFVSKGVYWAVIKPDGKYQKIPEIISRLKKNVGYCF